MRSLHAIVIALAVCCGKAVALDLNNLDETSLYPETHPFETDADKPPSWPASTPSYTYDDNDVGGYIYTFGWKMQMLGGSLTMDNCPHAPCSNGFYMYLFVAIFEMVPQEDPDELNCTKIGFYFAASDFSGLVAGERVCDVGSCCDAVYGLAKYSDDVPDYEDWLNNRVTGSMCDTPHHDMYCIWVGGDFWLNCIEYTPSPTDRYYIVPCYDGHFLFNMNCKVFTVEYPINYKKEPPIYYALLSNVELMSNDAFQMIQDRICHPNHYYAPSAASVSDQIGSGAASSDSSSDSPSSDSPSPDSASDSSSALSLSLIAVAVSAMLL